MVNPNCVSAQNVHSGVCGLLSVLCALKKEQNKINKESIEIVFEQIMSKKADSVFQALEKAAIIQLTDEELDEILDEIIQNNLAKVNEEQMRALSGLMGIAMKQVRGKASGKIINQKLKDKIQKILK